MCVWGGGHSRTPSKNKYFERALSTLHVLRHKLDVWKPKCLMSPEKCTSLRAPSSFRKTAISNESLNILKPLLFECLHTAQLEKIDDNKFCEQLKLPRVRFSISRSKSGNTPKALSQQILNFQVSERLEIPKPWNTEHIPSPEEFQNCATPQYGWDRSFFEGPPPRNSQS